LTSPRVWPQPLLVVRDVARSRDFYVAVLGAESGHGGDEYDQIVDGGEILLQLHRHDVEDHHGLLSSSPTSRPRSTEPASTAQRS
jgi:catechol 2,3-dioxygenase-like lactoylglutathione lyase family enzyme